MSQLTVRRSALDGWRSTLTDAGYEVERLETTRSMQSRSHGDDTHMSLAQFVDFSELLVRETRDVSIPWLVGKRYDLSSLGEVGDAVNAASSVGEALRRFVGYFDLLQDCTDIRLDCGEQFATLTYRILDPDIWPRHHDAMFSMGILSQILNEGSANVWDHIEFCFEADRSEMVGPIDHIVDAPCSFGADANMMRFPVRYLDRSVQPKTKLAPLSELNRSLVAKSRSTPLANRLAQVVLRDLDRLTIDQDRVAREMGMSSRTMRRKLASSGLSFQQILDECRMRQAQFEFRTRPHLPIAEIALKLGYSEHSTFTRAFHRWFGESPQAYRSRITNQIN